MKERVYVTVRAYSSAYQCSHRGMRASSTSGPKFAAERLGGKLFGERFQGAVQLPPATGDDHTITRWRLEATPQQADGISYVDCGECPRVSTGCAKVCEKAQRRDDAIVQLARRTGR